MLIYDLTLPSMAKVVKNLNKLYLLHEVLEDAIDKRKFINNPDKLQLAYDLKYTLTQELMEYEEWVATCKEYLEENKKVGK